MPLYLILGVVVVQRLGELAYARRNTVRLLARGGTETGAGHYSLFILLHGSWLAALAVSVPVETGLNLPLLLVFGALQVARVWVLVSLGPHWTTRVISVPGTSLVRRGPYRFLRHPNYAIVTAEVAVLPLVFGAWEIAVIFSLLNLALLRHRIRIENAVLAPLRDAD